jgi:hypothetical protein
VCRPAIRRTAFRCCRRSSRHDRARRRTAPSLSSPTSAGSTMTLLVRNLR